MISIKFIRCLSIAVVILVIISAGTGLFWRTGGQPFDALTIRGESVKMYGDGLYAYDTYFKALINKGTDAFTLLIAVPLLLWAILLSRGERVKGRLLLAGVLSYFLYYSACMTFGVSYNMMFPVYLLMFSASLFAFIGCMISLGRVDFSRLAAAKMPHRGISIFLILAGLSTFVWLIELVGAAISGQPPTTLDIYTSEVSFIVDPTIIAPTAFAAAAMILRRKAFGYINGSILLTLNSMVGLMVIFQTVFQRQAGIEITIAELIVYVGIFVVMSGFAIGLNCALFNNLKE